jgi:ATP synthase protein I
MTQQTSTPALQSLGLQLGLTLLASAVLLPFSAAASLAALLGGAIAIAGNLAVVALVFRRYRAAEPGGLATRMMGGELARLVLVAVGFGLVFVNVKDPAVLVLFGSFLVVHLLPVWWMHRVSDQAMKR